MFRLIPKCSACKGATSVYDATVHARVLCRRCNGSGCAYDPQPEATLYPTPFEVRQGFEGVRRAQR